MTSHELARRLLEMPDLMVTVNGYESGVEEIELLCEPRPIELNKNKNWWEGKHQYYRHEPAPEDAPLAIHIG